MIDAATPDQIAIVARKMRAKDVEEFSAVNFVEDGAQLADHLVGRYSGRSDVLCASHPEFGPVAIGAAIEGRPNVVTLMFYATDDFQAVAIELTRFITKQLFPRFQAAGVHRIECISIEGHSAAQRWIEILGLKQEATLKGFGKRGETFFQFAWVADHVG